MASSVLSYIINVVKKGSGDKQTVTALQSVKSVMTGVGAAAAVATTAYVAYDKVIGESTRFTVKYADEIRKLMSITKQNAKETSIMYQVADDYKVTNEQLLKGAKALATQGYALNIKTLAKLSDQYKGLATAQEKQQFLTKNFAKSGQDYITLLEAGSDALLKQADAVNKNLILTNEQVRAARELEIAEDNLLETKEALYLAVGTRYIPVWTRYLESLTDVAEGGNVLKEIVGNLTWFLDDNAEAATGATKGHRGLIEAMEDEIDMAEDLSDALKGTKDSGAEMAARMVEASLAVDGVIDEEDVQKLLDFRLKMGLLTQEEYNAAQRALDLKGAIDGLPAEKQIDISIYYHTYGFFPGQLLSNNTPKNINIYSEKNDPTTVYKPKPETETRYGNMQASGGPPNMGGWTMVGEHGKELIGPDGYIHSNAESRRLVAAGVTPFRGMATGGAVFSEPGAVFNPIVTSSSSRREAQRRVNLTSARSIPGGAASLLSSSSSSSYTPAAAQQAAEATQQAAEVNIAAARSVAASSQSIQESNVRAVSATQIQTAVNTQQNNAMLQEMRGLRNDIKTIIPKAISDAYQKVVGA